ncbi:hypothetical protein BJ973_001276 [Actinoplanes tereljensis]|uniref:Uncharacterized protein n=1 Tax=Paractinoplanes tereljensis TaxID=571912 RepID=A0A919NMC0_9ACTN|nr:hypothetical protein [Actinoplanes tereljensis]GIF20818.1 hypothetical protein Ate02nite_35480 [Actinoplanes tereljensis]
MTVLAHGVGQSTDLPLPLDLVLQAGAATVAISFLGSALLWRRARLSPATECHPRSTWWRLPARLAVLAVSIYIVADALFGPRDASNPAAHALYVWLWVGLIPLSVALGPAWRAVNPLRTAYRLLRLDRIPHPPTPAVGAAGPWVATVGLLGFAWLELVAPGRTDPLVIGLVLVGYAAVQLGLAARFGEDWFGRGDAFEVYSDLAGRLSPLRWRPWLSGLAVDHPAGIGRAAFLAVWWGSTVFDSATGSPAWAGFVQRHGHATGLGTAGLVAVCGLVFLGVRRSGVANSLIPIAVGYTVAHYLTSLLVEGPRGVLLLVQQWGLAEGAVWTVGPDARVVSVLQVVLILSGHAVGVLVAHDLALAAAPPGRPPLATLADELPVVLFMIACTWAGLFLLFVR